MFLLRLQPPTVVGSLITAVILLCSACDAPSYTEVGAIRLVRNQKSNRGRTLDQIMRALDTAMASRKITLESRDWSANQIQGAKWTVHMKEQIRNPVVGRVIENEYVWNINLENKQISPVNALAKGTAELLRSDQVGSR